MNPVVETSRTMKLVIDDTDLMFVLPSPNVDSEHFTAGGNPMVVALTVLGPQFVARGFAFNSFRSDRRDYYGWSLRSIGCTISVAERVTVVVTMSFSNDARTSMSLLTGTLQNLK